jgi:hypothetical protein
MREGSVGEPVEVSQGVGVIDRVASIRVFVRVGNGCRGDRINGTEILEVERRYTEGTGALDGPPWSGCPGRLITMYILVHQRITATI